jgi:hypothetical protein
VRFHSWGEVKWQNFGSEVTGSEAMDGHLHCPADAFGLSKAAVGQPRTDDRTFPAVGSNRQWERKRG